MAFIKTYYKVYRVEPEPEWFYIQNEYNGTNSLRVDLSSSSFDVGDAEYKINEDGAWTALNYGTTNTINMPTNGKVFFRARNWGKKTMGARTFEANYGYSAHGNIMSINDYLNMNSNTIKPYLCSYMFDYKLISADFSLGNASIVGDYSFYQIFKDNHSITDSIPDFSKIERVGKYGFCGSFNGCDKLTKTPNFSNVQYVDAYGFKDCLAQTKITYGADFSNVTECLSYSFQQIYFSCKNIQYVIAPSITSWNTNTFYRWLNQASASGIINKPSNLSIPLNSDSGVPDGWTTEDR